jgi:hypothetical protein
MTTRVALAVVFTSRTGLMLAGALTLATLGVACGGVDQQSVNPAAPTVSTAAVGSIQSASAAAVMAAREPGSVPRQLTGQLDGRFDFTRMWGDAWWQFYSDSRATGTLSHLGLSQVYTTHIPNLETGALEQGTFRIVAANGDEIRGTYEGTGTYDEHRMDLVHGMATFVISGGTGRFHGATGTIAATFLETLDDPTWASAKVAWTFTGTVNY